MHTDLITTEIKWVIYTTLIFELFIDFYFVSKFKN